MWILMLNDMRDPKVEILRPVLKAETKKEIYNFLMVNAHPWRDGQWQKAFAKDSILEWYNEPMYENVNFIDVGTKEEYIQRQAKIAEEKWNINIEPLPLITGL